MARLQQGVKVCAATCGRCGGATSQRRRLDSLTDDLLNQVLSSVPSNPSSIVGANGCVDARTAKPAIDSLAGWVRVGWGQGTPSECNI